MQTAHFDLCDLTHNMHETIRYLAYSFTGPRRLGFGLRREPTIFQNRGKAMLEGLFQPIHLLIILVIILIVFGAGKLPEVGGGLGKSITEFRRGVRDATTDDPVAESPAIGITAPAAVKNTAQTCATCGASMPAGARFCANCGAKVSA